VIGNALHDQGPVNNIGYTDGRIDTVTNRFNFRQLRKKQMGNNRDNLKHGDTVKRIEDRRRESHDNNSTSTENLGARSDGKGRTPSDQWKKC